MLFLIFVISIVVILLAWLFANEFYSIAVMKGHTERKYFWFCLLFGIVGYLIVIALPKENILDFDDELPEL